MYVFFILAFPYSSETWGSSFTFTWNFASSQTGGGRCMETCLCKGGRLWNLLGAFPVLFYPILFSNSNAVSTAVSMCFRPQGIGSVKIAPLPLASLTQPRIVTRFAGGPKNVTPPILKPPGFVFGPKFQGPQRGALSLGGGLIWEGG